MDVDTVWVMKRELLTERFQMKAPMEERPATA
jgi:hypothetical protein